MRAPLHVAHADTSAGELCWAFGLAPREALAVLPVELAGHAAGARLELRILGASHQALLRRPGPEDGGDPAGRGDGEPAVALSETVACLPGTRGGLPDSAVEYVDGWSYSFTAHVRRYPRSQFRAYVDRLLSRAEHCPDAIAATFPESAHAVTVASVAPVTPGRDALNWRTWHTYPQDGDVVVTRTEVSRR